MDFGSSRTFTGQRSNHELHGAKWRNVLDNHALDLVRRAEYAPDFGPSMILSIDLGILFVMAVWSGTSIQSIRRLNEVLPQADPNQRAALFIADPDHPEALQGIPELYGKLHGHGEMAWIHTGRIIATSRFGFNPDLITTKTKYLASLSTPRASA